MESAIPIRLGGGSRLMDTGGAKGQASPSSAADVIERATRFLGIDHTMVINEYGMTEMCSQLYDATSFNSHHSDRAETRVAGITAAIGDSDPQLARLGLETALKECPPAVVPRLLQRIGEDSFPQELVALAVQVLAASRAASAMPCLCGLATRRGRFLANTVCAAFVHPA